MAKRQKQGHSLGKWGQVFTFSILNYCFRKIEKGITGIDDE
jgi:hypothetical protein